MGYSATKYISVAGAGAKDGSSSANAWDNTQWATAIAAIGGNTKLIVQAGTYPQTGALTFNGTSGSSTQRNAVVVADGSWVEDYSGASIAAFTGGGGAYNGLASNMNYTDYYNMTFTNYASIGLNNVGGITACTFNNMTFDNCTVGGQSLGGCVLNRVKFINCSSDGFNFCTSATFNFCIFDNNGRDGAGSSSNTNTFNYCIFSKNTRDGSWGGNGNHYLGCIFNRNGAQGLNSSSVSTIMVEWCRFTYNGAYGISFSSSAQYIVSQINCSFYSNTSGEINYNGTSQEQGLDNITLTADPYEDETNDIYTTLSTNEGVNTELVMDANNSAFMTMQFPPNTHPVVADNQDYEYTEHRYV